MTIFLRDLIAVSIVLGIMIFVHEWGHFIAAKLFGVRVDVFSFGFGPRLFGVKRGDTDYRLSALPFGGYVRMAGDNVVEERTGADYEYLSKPRWQRVVIAIAGPAMNVLLAFLIFWGIYWLVGVPYETGSSPARRCGRRSRHSSNRLGSRSRATALSRSTARRPPPGKRFCLG